MAAVRCESRSSGQSNVEKRKFSHSFDDGDGEVENDLENELESESLAWPLFSSWKIYVIPSNCPDMQTLIHSFIHEAGL